MSPYKTIKTIYSEIGDGGDEECKTYDYDSYLDRLQVLFSSRNKLKGDLSLKQLKSKSKSLGKFGKDSARVQLL